MNRKLTILIVFLTINFFQTLSQSPVRQANFERLTNHKTVTDFCSGLVSLYNHFIIDTIGFSHSYQPIICIRSMAAKPETKLRVLFIGGQHGNEASPREALLDFLDDFVKNKLLIDLSNIQFAIIPQINPDGGDNYKRDNALGVDLNRDHVLLISKENQALHKFVHDYDPHVTVDMHEYQPYRESWEKWGFLRQFDIQLGGLTNIATDPEIRKFQYNRVLPQVRSTLEQSGISFNEYLLGYLPGNERMRRSTVDISDGRQSFGITGTMSFIIEGINGREPTHKLERRVNSQKSTVVSLLAICAQYSAEIISIVENAREKLTSAQVTSIPLRQDHFCNGTCVEYRLLNIRNQKDTVFIVSDFHPVVKSLLDVKPVKAWLVPRSDTALVTLLLRHELKPTEPMQDTVLAYQLFVNKIVTDTIEELETRLPVVFEKTIPVNSKEYLFFPVANRYFYWLHFLLEPQSSLSLQNYPEFGYLLEAEAGYSILYLK